MLSFGTLKVSLAFFSFNFPSHLPELWFLLPLIDLLHLKLAVKWHLRQLILFFDDSHFSLNFFDLLFVFQLLAVSISLFSSDSLGKEIRYLFGFATSPRFRSSRRAVSFVLRIIFVQENVLRGCTLSNSRHHSDIEVDFGFIRTMSSRSH